MTPRVYNALKRQMLRKSDRATMAKHVSAELSAAALRRLKVADLRRACDVLGVPSAGDKKLLVEMLKAHFDEAERLFAREFVEKIVDLDKEVAARKGKARRLAEAERRGSPRAPRREAVARDRGDAAAAAAAAGAAAREGAAGKRRIGERASARRRARPPGSGAGTTTTLRRRRQRPRRRTTTVSSVSRRKTFFFRRRRRTRRPTRRTTRRMMRRPIRTT